MHGSRVARFAVLLPLVLAALHAQQAERPTHDVRGALRGLDEQRARITLWHDDMARISMDPVAERIAAADGSFALPSVPWFERQQWGQNQFVLVARSPGKVGIATLRGDAAADEPLAVDLVETVDLRGELRDARTNQPIAGAWVWLSMIGGTEGVWITSPMLPWRAETDANGAFVLPGVPKGQPLKLIAGGADHERTWLDVADATERATFELRQGGRIRGVVHLPDGSPASRVLVRAAGRGIGYGFTRTDDEGRFTLSALAEDEYKVWASVPDLTVVAVTGLMVAPGVELDGQKVQLVAGGFIFGRILDLETGAPFVPEAHTDVAMYGPARGDGGACECTPVLPDGTFRIRAPAGRNRIYLRAAGRGYSEPTEYVDVVEGQQTEVVWRLRKAPAAKGR